MADLLGESPSLFDDVFNEFKNWKMISNSHDNFSGDEDEQSK